MTIILISTPDDRTAIVGTDGKGAHLPVGSAAKAATSLSKSVAIALTGEFSPGDLGSTLLDAARVSLATDPTSMIEDLCAAANRLSSNGIATGEDKWFVDIVGWGSDSISRPTLHTLTARKNSPNDTLWQLELKESQVLQTPSRWRGCYDASEPDVFPTAAAVEAAVRQRAQSGLCSALCGEPFGCVTIRRSLRPQ